LKDFILCSSVGKNRLKIDTNDKIDYFNLINAKWLLETDNEVVQLNKSNYSHPLQILQSSMQINITVYVAGNSGLLEASIDNANFIQVQTPSTGNMTLFQPAPTFQFNINPTVVPSIVTLRLRNIRNGYSILSFDVISTTLITTTTTTTIKTINTISSDSSKIVISSNIIVSYLIIILASSSSIFNSLT